MRVLVMVMVMAALCACGVPREAGMLAQRQTAGLAAVPGDEGSVRAALLAQADAWNSFRNMMDERAAFGVTVDADFMALVEQTAALARRQRELIQDGADDPAQNQAALEELRKLWADAAKYLGN